MRFYSPETICGRALRLAAVVLAFAVFAPSARAQSTRNVSIELTATTSTTSPYVTLKWPSAGSYSLSLYVRPKGSSNWGTAISLPAGTTSYADTNALPGVAYEYSIATFYSASAVAYGAIVAGSNIPLVEQRGNAILLVDNTMSGPLASEISQLQQDLVADGWVVYWHDVPRQTISASSTNATDYAARAAEVQNIRTIVQNDYNNNGKGNNWALFILGRVPVPYSGANCPDGHGDHYGAWPSDLYYADVSGTWTDSTVTVNTADTTDKRNWNVPGDGKLDQNNAPASIALQCGRVDLANMGNTPAGMSETELLRQYLVRDHRFRCKIAPFDNVARRGIVDDNFGYFYSEAFASSGWRTGFSWFGNAAGQMDALDWFTTLQTTPMLLAYGCGAGYYTDCTNVGISSDFAKKDSKAVFNMMFGSYFGDWDSPSDNILRAPLAGTSNSLGLVNVWSGRGYFNLFHMALGDTVGYCARFTENDPQVVTGGWPGNWGAGEISMNLMGDPTLRLHSIAPPPKVTAASTGSGVAVSWLPSPDLPAVDPTVAYWRFESGNVTGDSGPNGLALSAGGTTSVVSYTLPTGSGAGSAIPKTVPQTKAANISGIQTFGSANYYKTNDAPALTMTKGITVEAFINLTALNANSSTFVSHGGNAANGSWLFRVTGAGTLLFEYAPAASADFWTGRTTLKMNGGPIIAGHDYYVCISLDLTTSAATGANFYIQDLTAGTALQSNPAINPSTGTATTHATTLYDTSLPLTIGGANGGALPFSGTIDEVRISNSALDASQLLITSPLSGYHVYRSASAAGPFTRITGTAASATAPTGSPLSTTTTTFTDTTAAAGTAYTYLVKAVKMELSASGTYANQSLGQAATISSTPAPAAPTRLVVSRTAAGTCLLTWDDNASDETGYLVERCDPTTGAWSQIISISANSTTYSDTAAPVGKIVSYRVRAQGSTANSGYSNVAADENLPGTFSDNSYNYITTKSVGNFTASALRSNGNAGSVSIDYATSNILGAAGTDYIASSGNLTWANGESGAKSPSVTIPNMSGTQPTKIFKLTYTNPTNGLSAGSPTKTFVYVTDPAAQTLPGTWATTTFGNVAAGQEGYAEQANGKFGLSVLSVDAPYNAITSDSGRFLYMPVTGDFQFTARLNFLSTAVTTNVNTGVMVRGGLDSAAITDALLQRSFISTLRGTRTSSGGGLSTAYTGTVDYNTPFTPPVWMRITRTGSTISISKSSDGVTWTKANADTTLALPNTAYVGFYLTSFTGIKYTMNEPLSYAQYDNVTLYSVPRGVPALTATPGTNPGEVALSWTAGTGAASYYLERSNAADGTFDAIVHQSGTTYTDTNLTPGQTYYYRVSAVNPLYLANTFSPVAWSTPAAASSLLLAASFGAFTTNGTNLALAAGNGSSSAYSSGMTALASGATPSRGRCVEVTATTSATSPYITLNWPAFDDGGTVYLRVRAKGSAYWGSMISLPTNSTSYADTNALPGVAYEYNVWGYNGNNTGGIVAGVNVPLVEQRGNVVLLVDNTMSVPLANEIAQLQQDLQADGWVVYRHDVARQTIAASDTNAAHYAARIAEQQAVRALIQTDYNNNGKGTNWSLFILGRVPVPYTGSGSIDQAADHAGAKPTDLYYADMSGNWTDSSVNLAAATDPRNINVPGDGKFDMETPPNVDMQCGRVDLANMPGVPAGMSETELLRQYLVRDHRFRSKIAPFDNVARRGIVDDGLGYNVNGNTAHASSGWRAGFSWFGTSAGQMDALDWFTTLQTTPMLLAYGCGAGTYTGCAGVGYSSDFASKDSKAVFNMMGGSYFGDWDSPANNFLRAPLAGTSNSLGLVNMWSGPGFFILFHMALGDTVGYSARVTAQGGQGWDTGWLFSSECTANLMGDPTLRLHSIAPPPKVTAASAAGGITLTWLPSTDSVSGYHVYRSVSANGTFTRLTGNATSATAPTGSPLASGATIFTDTTPVAGTSYTYLVKAVKMETSASGTYANQSLGQPVTITHLASTPSPAPPTRLAVSRTAAGTCLLTWDDNASDETGYLVERCDPTTGAWSQIASLSANSTTYSDTAAPVGQIVSYRVRAQGSAANSAYSNVAADQNLPGLFAENYYSYVTAKTAGTLSPSPRRFSGSAGSVGVNYATSDILGTAGVDYIGSSGNLTWANGESGTKSPSFTFPNLSGTQPTKIFKLSYTNPTNGLFLTSPSSSYVYIADAAAQTLPSPWTSAILGAGNTTSSVSGPAWYTEQVNGSFGLASANVSGTTNGSTADAGVFLYQPVTGDFQLTARLKYLSTAVTTNVLAGMMIRNGTDTSAMSDALLQPYYISLNRATRTSTGGTLSLAASGSNWNPFHAPVWIRMVRWGTIYTSFYQSADGVAWTKVGADGVLSSLPSSAYAGLWLTSATSNPEPMSFAQFDNVTLYSEPSPVTTLTATPGSGSQSGQISLSWTAATGATSYYVERSLSPWDGFERVGHPLSTAYTDTNLTPGQTYYYRVAAVNQFYLATHYSSVASNVANLAADISGWRFTNFGSGANTGNGSDSATPAGDGVPNLIKYATGLAPWTPAAHAPGIPQVQQVGGVNYLTLAFPRVLAATDVTYRVEAASDINGTWTAIDPLLPANQVTVQDNTPSAGIQTITVKDTQPLSNFTKRFMRLRVTCP